MAEEKKKNQEDVHGGQKEMPVWEWIVAAIGLALVIVAIGTMIYRAVTEDPSLPVLEIRVNSIVPTNTGYLVKFSVKNSGSQTAAALTVEGSLKQDGETVETSAATLTYAPANSEREGGLFFTKNPEEFELEMRATGYEKP